MSSQLEHFDYILLGSGAGNKLLAWTLSASQQGKKVAVIEHKWIGGSCPNIACLPSKNFVHSANVAHLVRNAQNYGLSAFVTETHADGKVDMRVVQDRKAKMVEEELKFHVNRFASTGTELIHGHGKFVGPKTVEVNGRILMGEVIIIGTGSTAVIDDSIPGLGVAKPLTHVELLDIDILPSHLVILGGGNEDPDIVSALVEVLHREGIEILTSTTVKKVVGVSGEEVEILLNGSTATVRGSHLLVAVGKAPNTSGIGLEAAGIKLTVHGHVAVNEQLQTSIPGVFAVGDCAGSPYFTHIGSDDFRIVYANLTGSPHPGGKNNRQVPFTLFTSPELAHVGLRERDAKAQGIKYRLCKVPMGSFLRTATLGQMDGFAKALIETDGDRILGFTALGHGAGELLAVVQLAMKLGVSYREIEDLVITHPTLNEGLAALFSTVPPRE